MRIEVRFDGLAYQELPRGKEFFIDMTEWREDESGAICAIGLEVSVREVRWKDGEFPVKRFELPTGGRPYIVGKGIGEIDHDGSSTAGFLGMQEGGVTGAGE